MRKWRFFSWLKSWLELAAAPSGPRIEPEESEDRPLIRDEPVLRQRLRRSLLSLPESVLRSRSQPSVARSFRPALKELKSKLPAPHSRWTARRPVEVRGPVSPRWKKGQASSPPVKGGEQTGPVEEESGRRAPLSRRAASEISSARSWRGVRPSLRTDLGLPVRRILAIAAPPDASPTESRGAVSPESQIRSPRADQSRPWPQIIRGHWLHLGPRLASAINKDTSSE